MSIRTREALKVWTVPMGGVLYAIQLRPHLVDHELHLLDAMTDNELEVLYLLEEYASIAALWTAIHHEQVETASELYELGMSHSTVCLLAAQLTAGKMHFDGADGW